MENYGQPKYEAYVQDGNMGWKFLRRAFPYSTFLEGKVSIWIPRFPTQFRRKDGQYVEAKTRQDAKAYVYAMRDRYEREEIRYVLDCALAAFDLADRYRPPTVIERVTQLEFDIS